MGDEHDRLDWPGEEHNRVQSWLWCGTFTGPGDTALERYYQTYGIRSDGRLAGTLTPAYHKSYRLYKVLDEFSSIAIQLIALGLFSDHETLWADALQAALRSVVWPPAARYQ